MTPYTLTGTSPGTVPIERVREVLDGKGFKPRPTSKGGYRACCPAHDDHEPSLDIDLGEDGKVLLCCRSHGCTYKAIIAALDLSESDLFPESTRRSRSDKMGQAAAKAKTTKGQKSTTQSTIIDVYEYHDARGKVVFEQVRLQMANGKKDFRSRRKKTDGSTAWDLKGVPVVPYNLPGILEADSEEFVFVVEGEKDANNLIALGLIATTNPGGAGKWKVEHSRPLRGRRVVVLPDNDTAGFDHADEVVALLGGIASEVRVVYLPDLNNKGDVSDWLEAGKTKDELLTLVNDTEPEEMPDSPDLGFIRRRPFPVDALPPVARDAVTRWSNDMKIAPEMYGVPILSALGGAIGTARKVRFGTKTAFPCIWSCVIAPSGTAKSDGHGKAFSPLWKHDGDRHNDYEVEHENHKARMLEYKRDAKRYEKGEIDLTPEEPAAPPEPHSIITDTTTAALAQVLQNNPRGVTVAPGELQTWFGSFNQHDKGNGDSATWIQLFDGSPYKITRKTGATVRGNASSVCLGGTIQPSVFRKAVIDKGGQHASSGLVARVLVTWPEAITPDLRWGDMNPPEAALYGELIDAMMSGLLPDQDGNHLVVEFDSVAQIAFERWYNGHDGEDGFKVRVAGADGILNAMFAKLAPEYLARFALIDHCVRVALGQVPGDMGIDAESVGRAIRLVEWFAHEAERIVSQFAGVGGIEADGHEQFDDTESLVAYIRAKGAKGAVPRQIIQARKHRYPTTEIVKARMTQLEALGDVVLVETRRKAGGHAKVVWYHKDHAPKETA